MWDNKKNNTNIKKRKMFKAFTSEHKNTILFYDSLAILGILLNFGAVAITNAMAVKQTPQSVTIRVMETNPITASTQGYVLHPRTFEFAKGFMARTIIWMIMVFSYIHFRFSLYSIRDLNRLGVLSVFSFLYLGWDFFNNFGYWIGFILWR